MLDNEYFMNLALKEASKADAINEVPVGAVLVSSDGSVISRGHNQRELKQSPSAHAEFMAIEKASKKLKSWRLEDFTLYVTLEPCPMCMGVALQSRIKKICFGAFDPKAGACGSTMDLSNNKKLNHKIKVESGILEKESSEMLKNFFKKLRNKTKKFKLEII